MWYILVYRLKSHIKCKTVELQYHINCVRLWKWPPVWRKPAIHYFPDNPYAGSKAVY
jgi:hypothetical protein